MKITFVCKYLGKGGAERVMSILINYFVHKGFQVQLILLYEDLIEYSIPDEVDVIYLGWKSTKFIPDLIARMKQLREVITGDCVISFIYSAIRDTVFSLIGKKNIKVIISDRSDPSREPAGWLRQQIRTVSYYFADTIVFQTQDAQKFFPKKIQKKSVIIPNPINDALPKPYKGVRKKIICAAGRLDDQKNFRLLIESFADFYKKHNDFKLYIYGRGPKLIELQELTRELSVEHVVFFPGFIKNIAEKMNEATMYISSSDYEGISNTMLEAMALGVPTICTDCPVGGARMTIKDGYNGLLVPVGSKKDITNAMLRVAEDPNLAAFLSQNAVNIREELKPDVICKMWYSLL